MLKQGISNDLVAWVQIRIGAKVDGIFGKNTKNKVIDYQKSHRLVVDGIVGPATLKCILKQYRVNMWLNLHLTCFYNIIKNWIYYKEWWLWLK